MNRSTRYLLVPAALAALTLPITASPAAAHDTKLLIGRMGWGGVTNQHHRAYACDNSADGFGIRTQYKFRFAGAARSVADRNGSARGCSDVRTGQKIVHYRVCATRNGQNVKCTAWKRP